MNLEIILEGLITPNTAIIKQAETELLHAFKHSETYGQLLYILGNNEKASIRQYAALLLQKQLCIEYNYEKLPYETKLSIRSTLLSMIAREPVRCVRSIMAEILGYVFVHENSSRRYWIDQSLQKIIEWLQAPLQSTMELGAFVLLKIAEIAADLYLERFHIIGKVFEATLRAAAANCELPPKVLQYVLRTMSLIPAEMGGFAEAEDFYQAAVPHITNMLRKMAINKTGGSNFNHGVEIFSNIVEFTPSLLDKDLAMLVEFMLSISRDTSCADDWRTSSLLWLCLLVKNRSSLIINLKLIDLIVVNSFEILSTEPESDDANEFLSNCERNTPLVYANMLIDTVALQIPAKFFFETLLTLLKEAFYDATNPLRRRAAFIVVATIAEGCRDAICDKHLPSVVTLLKQGLGDVMSSVRNAALYAIGQFCEHLQPEFVELAGDLLPLLITYAQSAVHVSVKGQVLDAKSTERLFYALETFCFAMDQGISPYVNDIIKLVFALLQSSTVITKIQGINLLKAIAHADCKKLLPWLRQLMQKLRSMITLIRQSNRDTETEDLRLSALSALAEIIRSLCQYELPYAEEIIAFGLQRLQQTEDVEERSSLLNFMSAWAMYCGEDFSLALPVVMQNIEICLTSSVNGACGDQNIMGTGNLTSYDSELVQEECSGANPYTEAKEQALLTIIELSEACPVAFAGHAKVLFERLFQHTDNCCQTICRTSFNALNAVAAVLFENDPYGSGKLALNKLLKHYLDIVTDSFDEKIVVEALISFGDAMSDIEGDIFANEKELQDSIARCIFRGLKFEYNCQCNVNLNYDINYKDKDIIKNIFILLECFGQAISSAEFAIYFAEMETLLLMHIQSANSENHESFFASMIGSLAEYYVSLCVNTQSYFLNHYQILMNATKQHSPRTLKNAINGLGQLFYHAGDIACSHLTELINYLSQIASTEPKRYVMQSIVGTLARLVLKYVNLVPLEQILPFIAEKLTVITDESDNEIIMECLKMLFDRFSMPMRHFIVPIVGKAVNNLAYGADSVALNKISVTLLETIRSAYPHEYREALSAPNIKKISKFDLKSISFKIGKEIL